MKNILLLSPFLLFAVTSCVKDEKPKEFEEFFRFKANGQSKAIGRNLSVSGGGGMFYCSIEGDTSLLIIAGTGESMAFFISNPKIADGTYLLNEKNYGGYRTFNSSVTFNYSTKLSYTGSINIKKTIYSLPAGTMKALDGTFSFKAYDSLNNKTVEITEGKFSMPLNEL